MIDLLNLPAGSGLEPLGQAALFAQRRRARKCIKIQAGATEEPKRQRISATNMFGIWHSVGKIAYKLELETYLIANVKRNG
jgi:hypothetical protein